MGCGHRSGAVARAVSGDRPENAATAPIACLDAGVTLAPVREGLFCFNAPWRLPFHDIDESDELPEEHFTRKAEHNGCRIDECNRDGDADERHHPRTSARHFGDQTGKELLLGHWIEMKSVLGGHKWSLVGRAGRNMLRGRHHSGKHRH
jgi:hypothetical protein